MTELPVSGFLVFLPVDHGAWTKSIYPRPGFPRLSTACQMGQLWQPPTAAICSCCRLCMSLPGWLSVSLLVLHAIPGESLQLLLLLRSRKPTPAAALASPDQSRGPCSVPCKPADKNNVKSPDAALSPLPLGFPAFLGPVK